MLETYLQMQAESGIISAESSAADADAPMPTRAEDVDKFMAELAAAAAGDAAASLAPAEDSGPQRI